MFWAFAALLLDLNESQFYIHIISELFNMPVLMTLIAFIAMKSSLDFDNQT